MSGPPSARGCDRRLRVLVVGHAGVPGGAELALVRQLRRLRRRGIDIHLCLGEDGPLVGMARDAGAPVHVLSLSRELLERRRDEIGTADILRFAPELISAAARVAAIARGERVDVVSAYTMKAFAFASLGARLARRPLLWQLHDIPAPPYFTPAARRAFLLMLLAAQPRVVVVHSRAMADAVPHRPTVTIPHGVDRSPRATPRSTAPRKLRVGMAARLAEWKGQHVVIEALAHIPPPARRRIELRIAGAPWFGEDAYADRLHHLVAEHALDETVRFVGHVDDINSFYRDVDVAVHASTVPEPFGNTVVEALAAGTPVVGADAGGVAEILGGCAGGILVRPGDPAALAGALTDLLAENPAQRGRRSEAAWRRARAYDARIEAIRLARCYRAVAAGRVTVA